VQCIFVAVEIEARDACHWLLSAGFPQYVQLYEGTLSAQYTYSRLGPAEIFAASRSFLCVGRLLLVFIDVSHNEVLR